MENNAYRFIAELKDLLVQSRNMSHEDVKRKADKISAMFEIQCQSNLDNGIDYCYGLPEYEGLNCRLAQLFHLWPHAYVRDCDSQLALRAEAGFEWNEEQSQSSTVNIAEVQKIISDFITNYSATDEEEENSDLASPLTKKQVLSFGVRVGLNDDVKTITRSFVDYIETHRSDDWCWEEDLICISQYLFDFTAEYTYKSMFCIPVDDLQCDIHDAFVYCKPDVPDWLDRNLNEIVVTTQVMLQDTADFIKENGFCQLPVEVWLEPVFYTVGLQAIEFVLDHCPKNEFDECLARHLFDS